MLTVDHGVVRNSRVLVRLEPKLAHGPLGSIHAIIVHQTNSRTALATMNGYAALSDGNGAHFLIDKDGTIYQTARLDEKCQHVGKIRNRCYEEHNCVGAEKTYYEALTKNPKTSFSKLLNEGRLHEQKKPYPARYPMNSDSLGIELVGMKLGDPDDDHSPWEVPTDQEQNSLQWLIRELLESYQLQRTDIFRHPQVSRKTDGEALDAHF